MKKTWLNYETKRQTYVKYIDSIDAVNIILRQFAVIFTTL